MTPAPERGPRCARCGCTAVEHRQEVSAEWELVPGPCLTCDCEGFVLLVEEAVDGVRVD